MADFIRQIRALRSKAREDLTKDLEYNNYNLSVTTYQRYAVGTIQCRLQKIADMAVLSTSGTTVSLDFMTPEERAYFEIIKKETAKVITEFKRCAGDESVAASSSIDSFMPPEKRVDAVRPEPAAPSPDIMPPDAMPMTADEGEPQELESEFPDDPDLYEKDADIPADDMPEDTPAPAAPDGDMMLVRIVTDVPEFEMDRVYRLRKDEVALLSKGIAENLISVGVAVPVAQS